MRTTVFMLEGDRVVPRVIPRPSWEPLEEYDGKPLEGVELVRIGGVRGAELQLVRIRAGGRFALHTSPDVAFCQIVRGRGKLGLPGGSALPYDGPELYVFLPGTLHDWHDIEEDTLLAVCLVREN